jgi:lipoate synthase
MINCIQREDTEDLGEEELKDLIDEINQMVDDDFIEEFLKDMPDGNHDIKDICLNVIKVLIMRLIN